MRNAMQQRASVLLAALTFLGTACAGTNVSDPGPGKRVQVTLDKEAYQSGDTVTAMIKNVSGVTVDYSNALCHKELQRLQGSEWSTVSPPPEGCTLEIRYLGPGQTVPFTYRLPSNVPGGVYRLAIPSPTPPNAQAPEPTVTTPPFSVNSVTL